MKSNNTFAVATTVFALSAGLLNTDITAIEIQTNQENAAKVRRTIHPVNEDRAEKTV